MKLETNRDPFNRRTLTDAESDGLDHIKTARATTEKVK